MLLAVEVHTFTFSYPLDYCHFAKIDKRKGTSNQTSVVTFRPD